ncbi:protein kinase domain containing protein [Theileria equi strain WA]|uniref:Protein kinase domain containing protein n=1 Tax=Theileria equi strain WA TaxID=1537102 RepID=L1LGB8_THEEQ|nr:protein kinase domain containing protein [Theileria equi strain WA]EKX74406.1 protein kinase domain containing protein [Theileria equi strain WA]|eukprot:XP_004833858.1 protein kinase domain containing protein [Theileria equi strain WA]
MKSGFLLSNEPKVSLLTKRDSKKDESPGHRKYRLDDLEFERNIGSGNFSQIWHVTLKSDPNTSYALKIYNIETVSNKNQVKSVQQERNALLTLNEPGNKHVIRLVDTFRDDMNVYLLYEFCKYGELWEEIKYTGIIDDDLARFYILQLIDAIEYIHARGLVHRDLKCENVAISEGNTLKIIDFGSSIYLNPDQDPDPETKADDTNKVGHHRTRRSFKHYVGTPNFMPPESISNVDSGKNRDIWSLGCLIYQMIVGRPCFYGSTPYFIYNRVKARDLRFPHHVNQDCRDLIEHLLVIDPEHRLGSNCISEIRNHKYLLEFTFRLHKCIDNIPNGDSDVSATHNESTPNIEITELMNDLSLKPNDSTISQDNHSTTKIHTEEEIKNHVQYIAEYIKGSKCIAQAKKMCKRISETMLKIEEDRESVNRKQHEKEYQENMAALGNTDTYGKYDEWVLKSLKNLMFWLYDETKQEILEEVKEADSWLKRSS